MTNRAEFRFRAKTIVTWLPRDIYCELHNKVKSNCNPCVIIVLQYRSICLSKRDSKREGLPIKIMDLATLSSKWITKRYSRDRWIHAVWVVLFAPGRIPNKVHTGRLRPEIQPLTFLYNIFIYQEKVHFSYTFHRKMVPLSHTYLRTLHTF